MRAAVLLAVLWVGPACQSTVALETPLPEGTKSVLVVSLGDGEPFVDAVEVDAHPSALVRSNDLWMVPFACSLQRLGLMPGRQSLELSAATLSVLPDGLGALHSAESDASDPNWKKAELSPAVDELLRRLPVPQQNRCFATRARFNPIQVALPGRLGAPLFATQVDPEHVMVGTQDGHALLVDREGHVEDLDVGGRVLMAVYKAPDGGIWAIDKNYELVRGRLRGALSLVATGAPLPPGLPYLALAGPTSQSNFELFLAGGTGGTRGFARFDGERWKELGRSGFENTIYLPAVVWLGPAEALAIGVDSDRNDAVIHYTNGATVSETLPGEAGAASLAHFPTIGTVVGRDNGELDVRQGHAWISLSIGQASHFTRAMAPVADGFIYETGLEVNFLRYEFGQYFPDIGGCPLEKLTTYAASHLAPLADGSIVATTLSAFDAPLELYVLQLSAPAKDCGLPR